MTGLPPGGSAWSATARTVPRRDGLDPDRALTAVPAGLPGHTTALPGHTTALPDHAGGLPGQADDLSGRTGAPSIHTDDLSGRADAGPVRAAERAVRMAADDPAAAGDLARSVLDALGIEAASAGSGAEAASIAYRALALAARELGDLPLAEEHLDRAVDIALTAGMPHRAAQARLSLVAVQAELGRPRQALAVGLEAEPYLTPAETARLGVNRAAALIRLGRHEEAIRHCDRAESLLGDDPVFLSGAMLNRGLACVYLGRFAAAETDLARSAELARAAGLEHVLALAEGNLPFLAARRGDLPAAFAAYLRAERSLFGCPERLATVRCDLAAR
nr:hypothetical protein GCM10020093_044680 [Planobispora longispora]